MKIKSITFKNFRAYKDETKVEFDDLTAFVGKNDIGKSTIMEALDIFFNEKKGVVPMDQSDINKENQLNGQNDILITAEFTDLPDELVIDATNSTNLSDEHLLTEDGNLVVKKVYPNAGAEKVYIVANHPSNAECNDLLSKKIKDLKEICNRNGIAMTNAAKSAALRKDIWNHFHDTLDLQIRNIDVSKEDAKTIWIELKKYLPVYTLFQSDRSNDDHDKEVQDPLKAAVKIIMNDHEVQTLCQNISTKVLGKLKEVSDRTLAKIQNMNPELGNTLNPKIPDNQELKWADVFKAVSITGENDIPLNKRGSGVKRLVLINFFRAQAEEKQNAADNKSGGIIYAIEEPETSQHIAHQEILIKSLLDLSQHDKVQVIISTHSSFIVKKLGFDKLRLITLEGNNRKVERVAAFDPQYTSLNEINYKIFGDASTEYHDELYCELEANVDAVSGQQWLKEYNAIHGKFNYIRMNNDGSRGNTLQLSKTDIIRHQIHHPDNNFNPRFTAQDLKDSIEQMRTFLETKR